MRDEVVVEVVEEIAEVWKAAQDEILEVVYGGDVRYRRHTGVSRGGGAGGDTGGGLGGAHAL